LSAGTRDAVRRTIILVVLALGAIGLALFVLSRSDIARDEVEAVWQRSSVAMLLASQLLMGAAILFMALRWRALLPAGSGVRLLPTSGIVASGLLLNYALPGPVGELAAATLLGRRYKLPIERCLAAGVHARFVGLATAGLLAGGAWLLSDLPVPEEHRTKVAGAAGLICLGALMLWVLSTRPVLLRGLSRHTVGRLGGPGRLGRGFAKIDEVVGNLADSLAQVGRVGWTRWAEAVVWSLGAHFSVTTGILLGAWGIGTDPSIPGVLFTYCAATAAVVVLIAFPGGQIGWDALFLGFYHFTTGASLLDAGAVTLLVRVQQLLLLLVGAIALPLVGGLSGETRGPAADAHPPG